MSNKGGLSKHDWVSENHRKLLEKRQMRWLRTLTNEGKPILHTERNEKCYITINDNNYY